MTIYQIGLLQVGFLCFVGFCIWALGKAVAPKRKPEPDWKAIAGRMHSILADPEEDSAIYCCKRAIRVYEEGGKAEPLFGGPPLLLQAYPIIHQFMHGMYPPSHKQVYDWLAAIEAKYPNIKKEAL